MTKLTRDQALQIYVRDPDAPAVSTESADDNRIPSTRLTERTDAGDGWHIRSTDGWLATIHDDGRVIYPGQNGHDDPDLTLERVRGTRSEVIAEGEPAANREPSEVEVSIDPHGDQ